VAEESGEVDVVGLSDFCGEPSLVPDLIGGSIFGGLGKKKCFRLFWAQGPGRHAHIRSVRMAIPLTSGRRAEDVSGQNEKMG
jgi:hypothetical protein